ncbi:MAG: Trehalose utilization [Firmicutes bacterium ADurb.Bin193]|nr:MAG: Trehalose utilization [Firmicutes bacterium ADurb.Bin193]
MKKALIVYGGWDGHEPKQVAEIFKQLLLNEGFTVEMSDTLDIFDDTDMLLGLNLIVPVWTMGEINGDYIKNVSAAIQSGVGLAGCHGGMCDSFRKNPLWQFITGSQWVAHPGGDGVEYVVNINKSSDSAIIKGMNDFTVKTEHYYIHVDPAVNVLATTRFPVIDGPHSANGSVDVPVVYTKRWGDGKVFYNSLGHVASVFDCPEAKELMRRGFIWAAK